MWEEKLGPRAVRAQFGRTKKSWGNSYPSSPSALTFFEIRHRQGLAAAVLVERRPYYPVRKCMSQETSAVFPCMFLGVSVVP